MFSQVRRCCVTWCQGTAASVGSQTLVRRELFTSFLLCRNSVLLLREGLILKVVIYTQPPVIPEPSFEP